MCLFVRVGLHLQELYLQIKASLLHQLAYESVSLCLYSHVTIVPPPLLGEKEASMALQSHPINPLFWAIPKILDWSCSIVPSSYQRWSHRWAELLEDHGGPFERSHQRQPVNKMYNKELTTRRGAARGLPPSAFGEGERDSKTVSILNGWDLQID